MANQSPRWLRNKTNPIILAILFSVCLLAVISCSGRKATVATSTGQKSSTPSISPGATATNTPKPPTVTLEPMAAIVNGEGISLADYQIELGQYQSALVETGTTPAPESDQVKTVLDNMIEETLLAQAARQAGYSVTDEMVQSQIDALATKLGSTTELANWEKQNGYNDQSFKKALTRSIAAAWERDQIISQVPTTADQVHARQILVNTLSEAQDILAKLKAGTDFATLAYYYNPTTGGDLGWFPKGYLTMPEVEDAAFSLKVGEYSDIIQSKIGYHIIQVIERDPNHPLSADARFVLQNQTLQKWIADRRSSSQIQIMLP